MRSSRVALSVALAVMAAGACTSMGPQNPMSFFVTSVGSGKGGDFGGLQGADAHCQALATATGAGGRTWHAYLSASASGSSPAVDARERIGSGPWRNAQGIVIAENVEALHGANHLTKLTALTEKGAIVNGVGDKPNMHDVLTGSTPEGRLSPAGTCNNWTSSTDDAKTIVGHADRTGLNDSAPAHSWNSSHPTRGCSQPALVATGGAGLLYCFAVD